MVVVQTIIKGLFKCYHAAIWIKQKFAQGWALPKQVQMSSSRAILLYKEGLDIYYRGGVLKRKMVGRLATSGSCEERQALMGWVQMY